MPLFRALAKNMAPMTNADESPTNRLTLFPIYLSLFIVSTLCYNQPLTKPVSAGWRRPNGYSFMLRSPNQRANQIRRSYKNEEFDWLFDFVIVT